MTNEEYIKEGMRIFRADHQSEPLPNSERIADQFLLACALEAMRNKLKTAREKGRGGWWREDCSIDYLRQLLHKHIEKGGMVDVMNVAAMIYVRETADGEQQQ